MPSPSEVARLRTATVQVAALAGRGLSEAFGSLDLGRPESARDALLRITPALVEDYGDAAAVVAADWYDEVRPSTARRFAAQLAPAVTAERVQATVRYAAGHLFTDAPTGTLGYLDGAVQRYVLEPARETVALSASRDPAHPKWTRVASAGACDFCQMLAGRTYATESAAGGSGGFHNHCSCTVIPVW